MSKPVSASAAELMAHTPQVGGTPPLTPHLEPKLMTKWVSLFRVHAEMNGANLPWSVTDDQMLPDQPAAYALMADLNPTTGTAEEKRSRKQRRTQDMQLAAMLRTATLNCSGQFDDVLQNEAYDNSGISMLSTIVKDLAIGDAELAAMYRADLDNDFPQLLGGHGTLHGVASAFKRKVLMLKNQLVAVTEKVDSSGQRPWAHLTVSDYDIGLRAYQRVLNSDVAKGDSELTADLNERLQTAPFVLVDFLTAIVDRMRYKVHSSSTQEVQVFGLQMNDATVDADKMQCYTCKAPGVTRRTCKNPSCVAAWKEKTAKWDQDKDKRKRSTKSRDGGGKNKAKKAKRTPLTPEQKKARPCRNHFNPATNCKHGKDCHFSHTIEPTTAVMERYRTKAREMHVRLTECSNKGGTCTVTCGVAAVSDELCEIDLPIEQTPSAMLSSYLEINPHMSLIVDVEHLFDDLTQHTYVTASHTATAAQISKERHEPSHLLNTLRKATDFIQMRYGLSDTGANRTCVPSASLVEEFKPCNQGDLIVFDANKNKRYATGTGTLRALVATEAGDVMLVVRDTWVVEDFPLVIGSKQLRAQCNLKLVGVPEGPSYYETGTGIKIELHTDTSGLEYLPFVPCTSNTTQGECYRRNGTVTELHPLTLIARRGNTPRRYFSSPDRKLLQGADVTFTTTVHSSRSMYLLQNSDSGEHAICDPPTLSDLERATAAQLETLLPQADNHLVFGFLHKLDYGSLKRYLTKCEAARRGHWLVDQRKLQSFDVLHHLLGHRSYRTVARFAKLAGIKFRDGAASTIFCDSCARTKTKKHPQRTFRPTAKRARKNVPGVFDHWHADVTGRCEPSEHQGFQYTLAFIDKATGWVKQYPMRQLIETTDRIKDFTLWLKGERVLMAKSGSTVISWDHVQTNDGESGVAFMRQPGPTPDSPTTRVRMDSASYFLSRATRDVYREANIVPEYSSAHSQQHNGKVERFHGTRDASARAMLRATNLPSSFWWWAQQQACYIYNLTPHSAYNDTSPHYQRFGVHPSAENLRAFGTECYTWINPSKRTKWADKTRAPSIYVGYSEETRSHLIYHWNPTDGRHSHLMATNHFSHNKHLPVRVAMPRDDIIVAPQPEGTAIDVQENINMQAKHFPDTVLDVPSPLDGTSIDGTAIPTGFITLDSPVTTTAEPDEDDAEFSGGVIGGTPGIGGTHIPMDDATGSLQYTEIDTDTIQIDYVNMTRALNLNLTKDYVVDYSNVFPDRPNYLIHAAKHERSAFVNGVDGPIHRSLTKAMSHGPHTNRRQNFIDARNKELRNAVDYGVFEEGFMCDLPADDQANVLPTLMNFAVKTKRGPDGVARVYDKTKARWLLRGDLCKEGVHFDPTDVSSPTPHMSSIRAIAALSTIWKSPLYTCDQTAAYLQAFAPDVGRDIWLSAPHDQRERRTVLRDGKWVETTVIYRMRKNLYGHPSASMQHYRRLSTFLMEKLGFRRSEYDPAVFYYKHNDTSPTQQPLVANSSKIDAAGVEAERELLEKVPTTPELEQDEIEDADIVCVWHVDDGLWTTKSEKMRTWFIEATNGYLGECDHRLAKDYLSVSIDQNDDFTECKLHQQSYAIEILNEFMPGHGDCNKKATPLPTGYSVNKSDCKKPGEYKSPIDYRACLGKLQYLVTCTRFDLCHAIGQLARVQGREGPEHVSKLRHLLKHLALTPDRGVRYTSGTHTYDVDVGTSETAKEGQMWCYTDSSHADAGICCDCPACKDKHGIPNIENDSMRTSLGLVVMLQGGPVDWKSQTAGRHYHSTESEIHALALGCKRAIFNKEVLNFIGLRQTAPPVYVDNAACLKACTSEFPTKRLNYIVKDMWIAKDFHFNKQLTIKSVMTDFNYADLPTKALPVIKHNYFVNKTMFDGPLTSTKITSLVNSAEFNTRLKNDEQLATTTAKAGGHNPGGHNPGGHNPGGHNPGGPTTDSLQLTTNNAFVQAVNSRKQKQTDKRKKKTNNDSPQKRLMDIMKQANPTTWVQIEALATNIVKLQDLISK